MSREKALKLEVKSREESAEKKPAMSFDLYFKKLMVKDARVLPHHKAAMKKYAEQHEIQALDEQGFDEVFKNY